MGECLGQGPLPRLPSLAIVTVPPPMVRVSLETCTAGAVSGTR